MPSPPLRTAAGAARARAAGGGRKHRQRPLDGVQGGAERMISRPYDSVMAQFLEPTSYDVVSIW